MVTVRGREIHSYRAMDLSTEKQERDAVREMLSMSHIRYLNCMPFGMFGR